MKNFLKKVWLYPVLVIWFIASVTFFEYYLNRGNTDLTKELSPASFPVVCMLRGDYEFNRSFGYSQPMDFAVVLLFWSMPLVIGSFYSFIIMLPFPLLLISRIKDEEKILEDGLPGYKEYEQKVKYHLFPFIW